MITEKNVLKQLKTVVDPELDVNIVDLGLIYDIKIVPLKEILKRVQAFGSETQVQIDMTLTSPGCPLSFVFQDLVREAVLKIKGVKRVFVNLVFEPAWNPDRMSEEAREKLEII